jgi:hypothetical protein
MTTPFHGRFNDDTQWLGYMLDAINDYAQSPELLLTALRKSTATVVQGIFADPMAATTVTNFLATVPAGAALIDDETIKQYCNQIVIHLDDIDQANQGLEEEDPNANAVLIKQRLDEAGDNLTNLLAPARDVLDLVPVDSNGTGLASYLLDALQTGGCNNVFASDARAVVEPLASHGFVPVPARIRNYLQEWYAIVV